jgi:hypothetical protein
MTNSRLISKAMPVLFAVILAWITIAPQDVTMGGVIGGFCDNDAACNSDSDQPCPPDNGCTAVSYIECNSGSGMTCSTTATNACYSADDKCTKKTQCRCLNNKS